MIASIFDTNGRLIAVLDGPEDSCQATATAYGATLLAGNWSGHYWPAEAEEPEPCGVLPYEDVTLQPYDVLTITEGEAGDTILVEGGDLVLTDDDPVELTFETVGVYPVSLQFLKYLPAYFEVTVSED